MELTEQEKIQQAKMDAMRNLTKGIAVDFKPILNKIKELVENNASKEEIFREVDRVLSIIAQLETISGLRNKEK